MRVTIRYIVNMKSLVKLALLLMLIAIAIELVLSYSKESSTDAYKFRKENIQCLNDSTCPTWFTCDARKGTPHTFMVLYGLVKS